MPSDEPLPDRCAAKCKQGSGYCTQYPVTGAERCRMHGGKNSGAPENNGNAITHGATADPTNLYENLTGAQADWVDAKVTGYCEPRGIDEGDPEYDLVHLGVMHMFQARRAHGELAKAGLSRTKVVGMSEFGEPITDEEAHYLSQVASGHTRDYRMAMKDAGVLNDPDSQQAEATESIAAILAAENGDA